MKFKDILKLSLRTFRARAGRTALTVVGMGIGIAAILFLVGLGYGLQKLLLDAITTSESLLTLDVAPGKGDGGLTSETVEEISHMEGVVEADPAFDAGLQVKYQDTATEASATVANPNFLVLDGKRISAGEIFGEDDPSEIAISTAFAKIFSQTESQMLGKNLSLSLRVAKKAASANSVDSASGAKQSAPGQYDKIDLPGNFKVAGFFESEELVAFLNPKEVEKYFPLTQFTRLKVKLRDGEELEKLRKNISDKGFAVSALSDTVMEVNKMFRGVKVVLAVFGMIALLVSAIGMFNTMTVALLERTKEIGIMKAIGASNMNILLMFILESSAMGFLGGLIGIALGILSGVIFNVLLNIVAVRLGGNSLILFSFPLWFLFFVLCFSILIGFLTGLMPARRAARIDPLDALRAK